LKLNASVFHIVVAVALAIQFVHYFGAGARTFVRPKLDDGGEEAGALFCVAGAGVLIMARVYRIALPNGVIALALVGASTFLYEWARRTVRGRGFYVIYSDDVPGSVCDGGPYAYVRHPLYLSYLIGFSATLVAFPNVFSALGWVVAAGYFIYGARHDEKVLGASDLSGAYAEYRQRTGMFFPVLRK
jgi:protein-S-isoprenylcysteine O-methyltransferase Ste14